MWVNVAIRVYETGTPKRVQRMNMMLNFLSTYNATKKTSVQ